jgi:hypothetical protein
MLNNPFEQVTKSSFRELVESGYAHFVLFAFRVHGWSDLNCELSHINLFEEAG